MNKSVKRRKKEKKKVREKVLKVKFFIHPYSFDDFVDDLKEDLDGRIEYLHSLQKKKK